MEQQPAQRRRRLGHRVAANSELAQTLERADHLGEGEGEGEGGLSETLGRADHLGEEGGGAGGAARAAAQGGAEREARAGLPPARSARLTFIAASSSPVG